MQRDTKLLIFDIGAFYAVGLALLLLCYCCNQPSRFLFFMLFWMKMTSVIVAFGLIYWLYCIAAATFGFPPRAPARYLGKVYLMAGVMLLVIQFASGLPDF